jgi:hypothetical protein
MAGAEPSDDVEVRDGREATLGTAQHEFLLSRLSRQFDASTVEESVRLKVGGGSVTVQVVPGSVDLSVSTLRGAIIDLKTVGAHKLAAVRRNGAYQDHIMQVTAYAVAKMQAGTPIKWIIIIYLDRASGDYEVCATRLTNRMAVSVVDHVLMVRSWADQDPMLAPQVDAHGRPMGGPGAGFDCNECPWLRACWGEDARPRQYPVRVYADSEVEELARQYDAARAAESAAKRTKEALARQLANVVPATYGAMRVSRSADSEVESGPAAIAMLRELGIDPPTTWRNGALQVRPVRKLPKD